MRYKVKSVEAEYTEYNEVCLRCGKSRTQRVPATPAPRSLPNATHPRTTGSWLGCKLGDHVFMPEHQVEEVS